MRANRCQARCIVDLALRAGPYDGLCACVQFLAARASLMPAPEYHRVIVLDGHCFVLLGCGWCVASVSVGGHPVNATGGNQRCADRTVHGRSTAGSRCVGRRSKPSSCGSRLAAQGFDVHGRVAVWHVAQLALRPL